MSLSLWVYSLKHASVSFHPRDWHPELPQKPTDGIAVQTRDPGTHKVSSSHRLHSVWGLFLKDERGNLNKIQSLSFFTR